MRQWNYKPHVYQSRVVASLLATAILLAACDGVNAVNAVNMVCSQVKVLVYLNDDDDDRTRAKDAGESPVRGEDNLRALKFEQAGATAVEIYAMQHRGAGRAVLWEDAQKTRRVNLPARYPTPVTLYLEGAVVSDPAEDILFEYHYWRGPSIDPRNAVCGGAAIATVYAIKSVTFVATAGSPLTPNPNAGGGDRIFPDKRSMTDPITHERVEVRAVITPPLAGVNVYLRSVDVDDPSDNTAPVDDESKKADNRGGPRPGKFSNGTPKIAGTTDANGEVTVRFHVTFQPGDNFKVVAACSEGFFKDMTARQNDGASARVVDAAGTPVSTNADPPSQGKASDLLTVWRTLTVELNSMSAPAAGQNDRTGTITAVTATANPSIFTVKLNTKLEQTDQYEDGRLQVGTTRYIVLGNTSNFFGTDQVNIFLWPGQAAPAAAVAFTLWDDDITATTPVLPSNPSMAHMATAFNPAYVNPAPTVTPGAPTVAFKKNIDDKADLLRLLRPAFTLTSSDMYWVAHVAGAFQPKATKGFFGAGDMDPDGTLPPGRTSPIGSPETDPVEGETPEGGDREYSAIYMEILRESASNEGMTVAHEVGHQFGAKHEGGLMTVRLGTFSGPNFVPTTLNRIRSVKKP